ncbi:hypothetical protein N9X90_06635, partial [Alphaproteobacteria bacterium]|nr:hypothetical protein [Alphaproteobacteria bacterium]
INGPDATKPLNIATTRPVDRIIKVSTDVKASIIGVNITPPPTPAITDKIATKKLKMKEMKTISTPENPKSPLRIFDLTNSSRNT